MRARGSGFLFKRNRIWWIGYSVRGTFLRESAHSTKEADAARLLKQRVAAAQSGRPVGSQIERTTLDDLIAMLLADYTANQRRSRDRVEQACAHLRRYFDGACKAVDITSDAIVSYQAARLEEHAAASTVNYETTMLRRAFRLAIRAGKASTRPEFDALHVSNARVGFFEVDHYRAVLAHLPVFLRPVITTAYITGWRTQSELLTRQWRHVDLDAGWLRLEPGESKNQEGRMFPFTPELRSLFEAQRERVSEIERATGRIVPFIFCHADGTPVRDFRSAWAKACKAAGVPGRLVHDLRRTAVRNLERAGVPRSAAMKLTGHKTEAVYRRYAITDAAMLQESVAKLAAFHDAAPEREAARKVVPITER